MDELLAFQAISAYALNAMEKQPIKPDATTQQSVSGETKSPDGLSLEGSRMADSITARKAFGGLRIPRGVYRFKTHEEADEWMAKMLARSEKPNA